MARRIAVDLLKERGAKEVYVHLAYAIGYEQPLQATAIIDGEHEFIKGYDLSPQGIIDFLDLKQPIYERTANFGHFETPSTGDKPFLGHKREGGYTSEFKEYYHDFFNDKFVKEIVYPHREKGYFVDCGATNGVLQSQSLRLEQDGWRGLCIEPCWAFVDDLKKNRPLAQIENSAIVPKNYEGQHSFKEQNAQTLSSVILNSKQMNEETYKVNGSSIISILKKNKGHQRLLISWG